jgi:hypothetical protein
MKQRPSGNKTSRISHDLEVFLSVLPSFPLPSRSRSLAGDAALHSFLGSAQRTALPLSFNRWKYFLPGSLSFLEDFGFLSVLSPASKSGSGQPIRFSFVLGKATIKQERYK